MVEIVPYCGGFLIQGTLEGKDTVQRLAVSDFESAVKKHFSSRGLDFTGGRMELHRRYPGGLLNEVLEPMGWRATHIDSAEVNRNFYSNSKQHPQYRHVYEFERV